MKRINVYNACIFLFDKIYFKPFVGLSVPGSVFHVYLTSLQSSTCLSPKPCNTLSGDTVRTCLLCYFVFKMKIKYRSVSTFNFHKYRLIIKRNWRRNSQKLSTKLMGKRLRGSALRATLSSVQNNNKEISISAGLMTGS